ncbi:MAG TPA: hypothetical protein DCS01_00830 [Idiomarina abyssalis]|jgi:hypothetical protein|nr:MULTISPECIES: hypothetical protein [Idiomarina]MAB22070.1 hypothetical protein [Idiomarina sp.]MBH93309.1 hypothetical protein [Idiomarina sp.]HAS13824.1 hypothetical protein [Idiomarina abyssalis]|tara:strand:+ start:28178 stop:28675 length:498 start_codon:yes stop_codon:yes gene_type:complete
MQIVAETLEVLAIKDKDASHSDLFGRSAFNRYYYAPFLITRETISEMKSNWKGTAHAEIPNLLVKGLRKPAAAIRTQVKVGLIDHGDKSRILGEFNSTGQELAQLLREAYDARIAADYEPELKIHKDGNIITLKSYSLSSAKNWPRRTRQLCSLLLRGWEDIGLA